MTWNCTCPPQWFENFEGICMSECPEYRSCGGWTWEPPCGGCDSCLMAQASYYDDGEFSRACQRFHLWQTLQVMAV